MDDGQEAARMTLKDAAALAKVRESEDEALSIVDREWRGARHSLSPYAATPEQLSLLRDAFHMGQASALRVMSDAAQDLDNDEMAVVKKMTSFTSELQAWFRVQNPAVRTTRINPFLP